MKLDQDALVAAAELVSRSGANQFEIGYLHDDVPTEEAGWYAHARFQGARIIEENHRGPVEAAEALARRLFDGARCRRCGDSITLSDQDDGCRWTRLADRWQPGCDLPIDYEIPAAR